MAWLVPLESNPDVMNKVKGQTRDAFCVIDIRASETTYGFLHNLGVPKKWQIVDVYGLDPDLLAFVPRPVLALILLFPCSDKYDKYKAVQEAELLAKGNEVSNNVFYLKQFVRNACGTIALIHSVANSLDKIQLGDGHLKQFLEDSSRLNPVERGELLQKAEGIINAHKEVALEGQTEAPDAHDPVDYHFISFVHKDGSLYELDGSKSFGPVNHGKASEETLLEDAARVCKEYMARDPDNLNFTMVALTASD